jgi:hypothetical protein
MKPRNDMPFVVSIAATVAVLMLAYWIGVMWRITD